MTKKKLAAISTAVILIVMTVIGASMAYLTDTKNADNTFTVGNVKIELIEQQRGENGLEAFSQSKKLLPIVGSAQGEKDEYGMPTAKNYVDKIVTVKNTGSEDAYIRTYFAIPSALDDGYETFNASLNVLHFNFGNKIVDGHAVSTYGSDWIWMHDGNWNYFETTINGIMYNVYFADYKTAVPANATTSPFVQGVYLDKSFEMKDDGAYAFGTKLDLGDGWDWSNVTCPVFSIACQAEGFDTPAAAFDAAFGEEYNPWSSAATNWH